jgi:hypothetical protein
MHKWGMIEQIHTLFDCWDYWARHTTPHINSCYWQLMNHISASKMNNRCTQKQYKVGMNFSYNTNSHSKIMIWIQKLMARHSLNIDGMSFHHLWVIRMGAYWHKLQDVENPTKNKPTTHIIFLLLWKTCQNFCPQMGWNFSHVYASSSKTQWQRRHPNPTMYANDMNFLINFQLISKWKLTLIVISFNCLITWFIFMF